MSLLPQLAFELLPGSRRVQMYALAVPTPAGTLGTVRVGSRVSWQF